MSAVTNNIIGQFEANLNAQAGTDRVAADKNTFLKLLVAQLTHQDPLNPTEDKEFIAQLAQFTSVEELQNLNKGMESLNSSYLRQQTTNAVSMIGMRVTAKGDIVSINTYEDGERMVSPIMVTFPTDAADVVVEVYSTNSNDTAASRVYSANIGAWPEGTHAWPWPGTDGAGNPMPDGNYIVSFKAVDANGNTILHDTKSMGTVVLVETQADGNHKLMLEDGRIVYFNNVEYVTDPKLLASNPGTEETPGGDKDKDKEEDETGQEKPSEKTENGSNENQETAQAA